MQAIKDMTRRRFLEMLGAAGGSAAVYEAMTSLGLIRIPEPWPGPVRLAQGAGNGKSVVVLGAGIGGLTAAYLLKNSSYQVAAILEAQGRAGGRNFTARKGTKVVERDQRTDRETTQECTFDDGLYLNLGPGRIPHHHRRVLNYCKQLRVRLEPYVMETTANLYQGDQAFGTAAQTNRHITNDTRGYIAELLAKAVNKGALDDALSPTDKVNLLSLLDSFGALDGAHRYPGSTRSGVKPGTPSVESPEKPVDRFPLETLLDAQFWKNRQFYQAKDFHWQPTLFQPVGVMDKIVDGFLDAGALRSLVRLSSPVRKITLAGEKVVVDYAGGQQPLEVDYCVSNIPLPVLAGIELVGFSAEFLQAVRSVTFDPTCKVGWQANRRFWEEDHEIYGGISRIEHPITQVWYPSNDYFSETGTLTGAYNYGKDAEDLGRMAPAERLALARDGAVKLHPEFADRATVDRGISIAWQNVPFMHGGWAGWSADAPEDTWAYRRLLKPDGRFYVVGDQVSHLPGWQEGAMMSAEHVYDLITGTKAVAEMSTSVVAPDTASVIY